MPPSKPFSWGFYVAWNLPNFKFRTSTAIMTMLTYGPWQHLMVLQTQLQYSLWYVGSLPPSVPTGMHGALSEIEVIEQSAHKTKRGQFLALTYVSSGLLADLKSHFFILKLSASLQAVTVIASIIRASLDVSFWYWLGSFDPLLSPKKGIS